MVKGFCLVSEVRMFSISFGFLWVLGMLLSCDQHNFSVSCCEHKCRFSVR